MSAAQDTDACRCCITLPTLDFNAPARIVVAVMSSRTLALLTLPLAVPFAMIACGQKPARTTDLDTLDAQLTAGNQADPMLAAALRDQIMVDPALAQQANDRAVRPPSRPAPGAIPPVDIAAAPDGVDAASLTAAPPAKDCPECRTAKGALTLGELARRQKNASMAACAARLRYSAVWATRLSDAVPLYPGGSVTEAAGAPDCGLRVVSFMTRAPVTKVIDWYYTRTSRLGYAADHQREGVQHVLGGTRGTAAYVLYLSPHDGGGTDVDLVTNEGR